MNDKANKKPLLKALANKGANMEAEMSFFEHIDVLRKHLIRTVIVIAFFMGLAFWYYDFLFDTIIMGPRNPNFFTYRVMCKMANLWPSLGSDFCITKIPGKIINTQMAGQFTLQMNSSVMAGVVLGFPYLLWELWRFIKPGLHERERKGAAGFVFFASVLFILGILFGYYIVAPLSVNFLSNYTVSAAIENTITIDSYLSSVATLTLGTGIIFELPVIIYILSKLGLMTPEFMKANRRYAVVLILLIAAIVTPTADVPTMLIVSAPLFLLFELSIHVAKRVTKNREQSLKSL